MLKMSTIGRNARVQTFAKVVDNFIYTFLFTVNGSKSEKKMKKIHKKQTIYNIVVCGKSSQICCSAPFSSGMVFGFD